MAEHLGRSLRWPQAGCLVSRELARAAPSCRDPEAKWPPATRLKFIVGSSLALWALILGAVLWAVG